MTANIVDYEQIQEFTKNSDILIVDVRDPQELESTGKIDNSINIPLPTLETVLKQLTADEFQMKFGRPKPTNETQIVFSCKMGGRAQKAAEIAGDLGYTNVSFYKGSWTEWAEKQGITK